MYQIEVESEIEGGSSCCVRIVNRRDVYLTEFDASFPDSTSHQIVMAALQAVMLLSSSACPICLGKILSRGMLLCMTLKMDKVDQEGYQRKPQSS
uniref:uncharacterized protein LOC105350541 isoform X2 n=1 Tax=Fragaria vesca subsp. vesca TaxID=101020 RepID=UPI0005C8DCCA|nr:PREDICTED: uncharacterized protein LOC105350541 isoform X2 [Fragaria vesca subsp. vesca]